MKFLGVIKIKIVLKIKKKIFPKESLDDFTVNSVKFLQPRKK
jgi:hypothetical protein